MDFLRGTKVQNLQEFLVLLGSFDLIGHWGFVLRGSLKLEAFIERVVAVLFCLGVVLISLVVELLKRFCVLRAHDNLFMNFSIEFSKQLIVSSHNSRFCLHSIGDLNVIFNKLSCISHIHWHFAFSKPVSLIEKGTSFIFRVFSFSLLEEFELA